MTRDTSLFAFAVDGGATSSLAIPDALVTGKTCTHVHGRKEEDAFPDTQTEQWDEQEEQEEDEDAIRARHEE